MAQKLYPPIHPGEVLMEDFIEGFGITQNKLAVSIGVPPRRINEIVHGKRAITADTALRLGRYFGVEPQFWLTCRLDTSLSLRRIAWLSRSMPSSRCRPHDAEGSAP